MKGDGYCPNLCASKSATEVVVAARPKDKPVVHDARVEVDSGNGKADSGLRGEDGDPRKIVVVVDGSRESISALLWALTRTIRPSDTLLLIGIGKNPEGVSRAGEVGEENNVVRAMKDICRTRKPQVHVESLLVEETEKGPSIVEEARKQEASLLILGHKKRNFTRRLLANRAREAAVGDELIDYCIKNAHCTAIAVRKREGNGGGYLLTTKKMKDFWLLA